ncbi:MAG: hypothetical protein HY456_03175 [Parcubacteria group bacterium]|nr:hypothetical protein [Parcubacteria group bacterium]
MGLNTKCPVHGNEHPDFLCPLNKSTFTLEQFKLACISDEEFTDEQVKVLSDKVVLQSEEEVVEFLAILNKYRPELLKKFTKEITKAH